MRYGLKDSILESIISIFARYSKIEKVLLYGSRAKGNFKNGSDIDLTLVGNDIDIKDLNKIYLELDELYLPYSFDISIFDKIQNKDLINHINRVGIEIYERE
ncbi:nucleotidyltransferase domain-containing protein [Proteiniborus sp. MB09-C3]|uniref:nucleotidyltransferase domain-containing protein n=1 Tax=Proteiniborus sp. MB09-C3 TaxID=3050072 RepID=UPI0025564D06|nr:nucleotidyltransferase domain-containing protein [Proteiniborus sp. MB09-C3]WIV12028.1 nucleotidyltransferase domain-containing protein [Proteiniborus sp. MB09-C3]